MNLSARKQVAGNSGESHYRSILSFGFDKALADGRIGRTPELQRKQCTGKLTHAARRCCERNAHTLFILAGTQYLRTHSAQKRKRSLISQRPLSI
jgi:hypothetical protein